VRAPSYDPSRWQIGSVVGGIALAIVAVVLPASRLAKAQWWLLLVISLGVILAILVLAHAPYCVSWMVSQWRRARSYDGLFQRVGEAIAERALAPKAPRLPLVGLTVSAGKLELVLDLRPSNGVARGDSLLLVDEVAVRLIGVARVARFRANRCFASVLEMEPVCGAFLGQHLSGQVPPGITVLREADVARCEDVGGGLEEAEPWR
jgi:hypothetical protein